MPGIHQSTAVFINFADIQRLGQGGDAYQRGRLVVVAPAGTPPQGMGGFKGAVKLGSADAAKLLVDAAGRLPGEMGKTMSMQLANVRARLGAQSAVAAGATSLSSRQATQLGSAPTDKKLITAMAKGLAQAISSRVDGEDSFAAAQTQAGARKFESMAGQRLDKGLEAAGAKNIPAEDWALLMDQAYAQAQAEAGVGHDIAAGTLAKAAEKLGASYPASLGKPADLFMLD